MPEKPGYIVKALSGKLGRNTLKVSLGSYLRAGIQIAIFLIIARSLGVAGYGAFAAVVALTAVFVPFAGLGQDALLVRDVSRDHLQFRDCWGRSLMMVLASGLPLVVIVVLLGRLILPSSISIWVVVAVAISDLIFVRILEMAARSFQAFEWMGRAVALRMLLSVLRLVGAVLMIWIYSEPDVQIWSAFYVAMSAIMFVVSVLYVNYTLGKPKWSPGNIRANISDGIFFSISGSADKINADVDKAMLARMTSLESAGIYSAAYRIVDVVFMPVSALIVSAYARFFQKGSTGIASSLSYALRILPIPALYSLIAGVVLYQMSPLLTVILGESFSDSVHVVQWLSVLPLLMVFRYFPSLALGAAGFQKIRSFFQTGAAVLNIMLNLWLIPLYGWRGAVWTTLVTEVLLGFMLWILCWRMLPSNKA